MYSKSYHLISNLCVWVLSFSVIVLTLIDSVAWRRIYCILFIHHLLDIWRFCQLLCIMNSANAIDYVREFEWACVFRSLGYLLRCGKLGYVLTLFSILKHWQDVFETSDTVFHSSRNFSTLSPTVLHCQHFYWSHPRGHEVLYKCEFDLYFPND